MGSLGSPGCRPGQAAPYSAAGSWASDERGLEPMKIGLFTDSLADLPFEQALDWAAAQGLQAVEIGTGNFSPAPHCDLQKLIDEQQARQQFLRALASRCLALGALTCNANL